MKFTNEEIFILKEIIELEINEVIEMIGKADKKDKKDLNKHLVKLQKILAKIKSDE